MIIVNVYYEEDHNTDSDGFHLNLASVVNDSLCLFRDVELITECIDNYFEPKYGVLYEIQLIRALISSDPVPEPAFVIDRVIEKKYCSENGTWITPLAII